MHHFLTQKSGFLSEKQRKMPKTREDVNAVLGDVLGLKVIPAPKRGRETAQEAFFCLG